MVIRLGSLRRRRRSCVIIIRIIFIGIISSSPSLGSRPSGVISRGRWRMMPVGIIIIRMIIMWRGMMLTMIRLPVVTIRGSRRCRCIRRRMSRTRRREARGRSRVIRLLIGIGNMIPLICHKGSISIIVGRWAGLLLRVEKR
jgi:hypothetical protein